MDSGDIDIPNSRALVKQILTLAQDVDNQPFIAQGKATSFTSNIFFTLTIEEGCLSGLCNYLKHEENDVVLMASRSIQFLSSHPLAREPLKTFPNMVTTLMDVYKTENR